MGTSVYPKNTQSSNLTPQPNQVEMPPDSELMELDVQEDILDLIDIPKVRLMDFDAWAHSVLNYQW